MGSMSRGVIQTERSLSVSPQCLSSYVLDASRSRHGATACWIWIISDESCSSCADGYRFLHGSGWQRSRPRRTQSRSVPPL